jgi:hypothetical protein
MMLHLVITYILKTITANIFAKDIKNYEFAKIKFLLQA